MAKQVSAEGAVDAILSALARFTAAADPALPLGHALTQFSSSRLAQAAVVTLFDVAGEHADMLRQGWTPLVDCLMRLHKLRLVEGDVDLGPGLRVLSAPGHAPGQLSLLVELPETGAVLLTSDAVSRPAEITRGFDTTADRETAVASAARIMEIAERAGAWIVWGHDPGQWRMLRKAPKGYG